MSNTPSGGPTQTIGRDPRLTAAIDWVWATLGAGVIGAVIYVGSQLGGLRDAVADTNLQVALSRQQATVILETLKDHEIRLRDNESEIRTMQGRNLRGPPEPTRGR
jgi:hypothetical protein